MQATTYGVTPKKVEVYNADIIKDFLLEEKEKIKFLDKKSCLYSNKFMIKDPILNYLNDYKIVYHLRFFYHLALLYQITYLLYPYF